MVLSYTDEIGAADDGDRVLMPWWTLGSYTFRLSLHSTNMEDDLHYKQRHDLFR